MPAMYFFVLAQYSSCQQGTSLSTHAAGIPEGLPRDRHLVHPIAVSLWMTALKHD